MNYKVLSLWQPWASLVVLGHKKIETRSWNTHYRGPLLIHASKNASAWKRAITEDHALREAYNGTNLGAIDKLPFGAIIGMVNVVGTCSTDKVSNRNAKRIFMLQGSPPSKYYPNGDGNIILTPQELAFGDYSPNRYGWVLSDPVQFKEPIPAKGMQGFWKPDEATSLLITQALAAMKTV